MGLSSQSIRIMLTHFWSSFQSIEQGDSGVPPPNQIVKDDLGALQPDQIKNGNMGHFPEQIE